ncbi:hypothetical protein JKP88DRAFT_279902 [Tribonema minus]|uniref:Uncharacterized protein n=1 Tax=Tribonema minus TaxID=303371 RepID=A0A836CDQ3_9STRA|nr:hypothetical protein JKP88DRAFT_279902 [Tribonema minus]
MGGESTLTALHLSYRTTLQSLPISVGALTQLSSLAERYCDLMALQRAALPESGALAAADLTDYRALTSLTDLNLRIRRALRRLSDSTGELAALKRLELGECGAQWSVPDTDDFWLNEF